MFGAARDATAAAPQTSTNPVAPDQAIATVNSTSLGAYGETLDYRVLDYPPGLESAMQYAEKNKQNNDNASLAILSVHKANSDLIDVGNDGSRVSESTTERNTLQDNYLDLGNLSIEYKEATWSSGWIGKAVFYARKTGGGILIVFSPYGNYGAGNRKFAQWVDSIRTLAGAAAQRSTRWAAEFPAVVERYRAANARPAANEDIHRIDILAGNAVQEKRFMDADGFYVQGIDADPWWPPFHYNRALILAELGVYSEAAVEMQRYLALVPDASNARDVQDKIYTWQARKDGIK